MSENAEYYFKSEILLIVCLFVYLVTHAFGCISVRESSNKVFDDLELSPEERVLAHVHLGEEGKHRK